MEERKTNNSSDISQGVPTLIRWISATSSLLAIFSCCGDWVGWCVCFPDDGWMGVFVGGAGVWCVMWVYAGGGGGLI